ncbi:CHRD domain-containing protein [Sphingomonas crusticola]|uniref:CHRD domain-containing protein n=1 Tax=Sphingomonas crusticola TaxID=1697973 RepID=UPI000E2480A0|nr:CHRD domain-containing protein [Sphingomonas crusticola]
MIQFRAALILLAAAAPIPVAAATTKFQVQLAGAAEVPGPGAAQGMGEAALTFDTGKNQLCYRLHAMGTDTPTMAHIHKGAAGTAGGVVLPLTAPTDGTSEGCAAVARDLLAAILATPSDYYVNVHTAAFPAGALRGQLK